jgi:hypothetical protein
MEIAASSGSTNPSLVNTRREFLGSFNTEARCGAASDPMATGWTLVLLHLVRF